MERRDQYRPLTRYAVEMKDVQLVVSALLIVIAGAVSLLSGTSLPLLPAYAQGTGESCTNGIAIPDWTNNPDLVADCEVLLALRDDLSVAATLNWSAETPIRNWDGVNVWGSPPRVWNLSSRSKWQLHGTIPPALGGLSGLRSLSLFDSELTGEIPAELANITTLERLHLYNNRLTGRIPRELGNLRNLQELLIGSNQLSGEIPAELGKLGNLEELSLSGNQLTGQIPPELGALTKLRELWLSGNRLSGEPPASLGSLSNLQIMALGSNQFTGPVPVWLFRLTNLEHLWLDGNKLTGQIPVELGNHPSLKFLELGDNRLTGSIPAELGGLVSLERLRLWENQLIGEIPATFGFLSNLQDLALWDNQLIGEIPHELGRLRNLSALSLGKNRLSGEIPPELGNLSNLQVLWLADNQLTGEIPAELSGLASLKQLVLSGNRLTGVIPPELIELRNLTLVNLQGMALQGCLPPVRYDRGTGPVEYQRPMCFVIEGGMLTVDRGHLPATEGRRFTGVGNLNRGSASFDDNTIEYWHDGSEATWDYFTYTVSDGAAIATETLNITVHPVNDPPIAAADGAVVQRGGSILLYADQLLKNDFDAEGEVLRITEVGDPDNGTVTLVGSQITYRHDGSDTVMDSFTYTASDGALATVGLVYITIGAAGDSPLAAADGAVVQEGNSISFQADELLDNDFDPGGGVLRITAVGDPNNGFVTLIGAKIVYQHDGSDTTLDSFPYTVSDGVFTTEGLVYIAVAPVNDPPPPVAVVSDPPAPVTTVNDPPSAVGDSVVVREGGFISIPADQLLNNDFDAQGDALTITKVGDAANGSVTFDGATITYLHDGSDTTTDGFIYTLSDGIHLARALVHVAISPVNDPPIAVPDDIVVQEGDTISIIVAELLANDADAEGDTLSITSVGDAVNGEVFLDGATVIYEHDGSETIMSNFTYTISDGAATARALVRITVRPVNDPPTAAEDTVLVQEGSMLSVQAQELLANDQDGDGDLLNITMVGDAENGIVTLDGNTIVYLHDGSETTSGSFIYTVTDGKDSVTALVTVTVRPTNDPPIAADDTVGVQEGGMLSIHVHGLLANDTDADGDSLNITTVVDAENGIVTLDGNTIVYWHDGSETTSGSFIYTVTDGTDSATALVTVTVRPANDPPIAVEDALVVLEGYSVSAEASGLLANDTDVDGDLLNIISVKDAENGVVTFDGDTITFWHDGSETTSGNFTYTVTDSTDFATAAVTVAVQAVNDSPIAVEDSLVVKNGDAVSVQTSLLLANDSDGEGDTLSITAVSDAVNGNAFLNGAIITYEHDGSETTSGSFTYTVTDGIDSTKTVVTVTVRPADPPPLLLWVAAALAIGLMVVAVALAFVVKRNKQAS